MKRILIVSSKSGDWEGVYVDGVLRGQNHRLSRCELLNLLGVDREEREISDEVLERGYGGWLPKFAEDLPKLID